MGKFKITQVWKHTETLIVDAEDENEALSLAQDMEFDVNHDDWLFSEKIEEV